ncbi:GTP-binding protein [Metabacillus sp. FJAT-52054]|uniref:GTP-binding protein n=1 Tax=Metabacillus sediminis TaxID=3117746 RepID=A0ABZ2NE08_9BACI
MQAIPVYVISGFLGSGKTTVLLKMLERLKERGKKTAVILNELGEVNLEAHLFQGETMYELLDGCICCTIKGDLSETLIRIAGELPDEPVDVLLIEGTGVANPAEIKSALMDPSISRTFELHSMIGIADAAHFLEYQSIFTSSKEIRMLMKEQIETADLLLMNKVDLIQDHKKNKIRRKLEKMVSSETSIIESIYADVSFSELEKKRSRIGEARGALHHHGTAIKTFRISPAQWTIRELEERLKAKPGLLRAKGIVSVEGGQAYSFQYASGIMEQEAISGTAEETAVILIGTGDDFTPEL